jgi:hypothetical protein
VCAEPDCGKAFSQKNRLTRHVRRRHTGEKSLVSPELGSGGEAAPPAEKRQEGGNGEGGGGVAAVATTCGANESKVKAKVTWKVPAKKRKRGNGEAKEDVVKDAISDRASSSLESYKNRLRKEIADSCNEIAVLQAKLTVKQDILKDLESIGGADR